MATKLSLVTRKNIKEYEEKMTEAKEALQAIVEGAEITYDIDYASLAPFAEKGGYKDRVGEVAFWFVEGLLGNFKRIFADETAKGSLQSAWTTGVIRVITGTLKKNEYKYSEVAIENGDLVITIFNIANVSECGSNILEKLGDSSGLSVKAAQDWKQYEEKRTERFQSIHEALQLSCDVTLDVDSVAFAAFADKEGYKDRVGECVDWYIEALESVFNRRYKDDELARGAVQAAWTTGVIRIVQGTLKKNEYKYTETNVDNGDLVITVYKFGNVSETGEDLLNKLGDASGLSLKSAQDWKQYEEKRTERFQSIHESLQLSCDVTLDVDSVAFAAFVDKEGYKDRVGECVDWYIEALESTFRRRYKDDELARGAVQAAWTTGVIRIVQGTLKKNEYKYTETNVDNGDLVITVYKLGNVSETGEDLLNKLGDASGLTVKSAQSWKEYEEKRTEHFQALQEATGVTCDVTLDIDLVLIEGVVKAAGYTDRIGECVEWILEGLTSNFKRVCQEELTKEAIGESWTTGVIRLEENKKINYHDVNFVDGNLVIFYNPKSFCSNVSDVGSNIESKL